MSRSFVAGPTGTIPEDEYIRKIQRTNVLEDPDAYDKYVRSELADFRPDAPFFESDQTRHPNDRGSGFGSRERLSLRHAGARSEEEPYTEGEFYDHEFLIPDPRGTQNQPNFDKAREQQTLRAKYVKFSKDDDFSVPETGISPAQMVSLIRGSQQQFKDRFRNFDESMDAWHNGSPVLRGTRHQSTMVTRDGTIVNLADAPSQLRQDPVNLLSNRTAAMLRMSGPDHRVKVSKYNQVRPNMDINYNAWNTNRYNSYLDHQVPVEINGQMVNKMLGALIMDLEGQRATKQAVAHGANYEDSSENYVREMAKRVAPEDIYKMMMIGMSSGSQPDAANVENYEGRQVLREGLRPGNPRASLTRAELNHEIATSIVQANRESAKRVNGRIQKAVVASAEDSGLYYVAGNRERTSQVNNRLARESLDTRKIEQSMTTKNYASVRPINADLHEAVDYEPYGKDSKDTMRRSAQRYARNTTVDDVEAEEKMPEFALPGRKEYVDPRDHMVRFNNAEYGDTTRRQSETPLSMRETLYDMLLRGT